MLPLRALGFCCGMFCFVRRRGVSLYSPATIYLPQAPLRSGRGGCRWSLSSGLPAEGRVSHGQPGPMVRARGLGNQLAPRAVRLGSLWSQGCFDHLI